jgi:alkylation response protein AidB-like acyl-CoA dehydrogenase
MEPIDPDQRELRATVRRVLERQAVEELPAGGYDPKLWRLLTEQVGVTSLAVPERFGGSGAGYVECHLVLEELGRGAVSSPFLASAVLSVQALLLSGSMEDADVAELLSSLAAGTRTATVILPGSLTASLTAGGWVLNGRAEQVLDGARTDDLLAYAETDTAPGTALFRLDANHPGLRREHTPTVDQSLHLAEVECRAVPAHLLSETGEDAPTAETKLPSSKISDLAAIAITADQIGGARRCLELTVDHVKTREQFGRPIGSFQAIKHRLADLLVLVESAHSASYAAAQAWADDTDDAPLLASLAKSYCSEAYRAVTAETIQLHGGIGFTWEHPAHRYFKRAQATAVLFGDPACHRARLAQSLGWTEGIDHPGGSSLP